MTTQTNRPTAPGAAGITIELSHGVVEVRHGSTGELLFQVEAAPGYWSNLWRAITSAEYINEVLEDHT